MDFGYIESLVRDCKNGDAKAKELLMEEFKPIIVNISLKYKIYGYEMSDLMNECYRALLYSISKYNTEYCRFVAYGGMAIKNAMIHLLRSTLSRKTIEGGETLTVSEGLIDTLEDGFNLENTVVNNELRVYLNKYLNLLNPEEKELINFVYLKNNSLRAYSIKKRMCYSTVFYRHKKIMLKLRSSLGVDI